MQPDVLRFCNRLVLDVKIQGCIVEFRLSFGSFACATGAAGDLWSMEVKQCHRAGELVSMEMGAGGRSQLCGRGGWSWRLMKDGLIKELGMLQAVIQFGWVYTAVG